MLQEEAHPQEEVMEMETGAKFKSTVEAAAMVIVRMAAAVAATATLSHQFFHQEEEKSFPMSSVSFKVIMDSPMVTLSSYGLLFRLAQSPVQKTSILDPLPSTG